MGAAGQTSGQVIEVGDGDFDGAVIERSREIPVLVDFWAPWCGPCRVLAPVLERIAADMPGTLLVVKLNVDQNPVVAARFRVSGIPRVILFHEGAPVGEFVGAQPEAQVRAFLEMHLPSQASQAVERSAELLACGNRDGARDCALAALASGPSPRVAGAAHLILAEVALRAHDLDSAVAHAREVPGAAPEWETAQATLAAADLGRTAMSAGDPAALRARIASSPQCELDDLFALAVYHLLDGEYRSALEGFLSVVERDCRWGDEAGRKAMLTTFVLAGTRSPLSDEYRRRLALLL